MQSGNWSGCLGGRGEELGKGPTSAVEALEQWALSSVGSCQVGGEGGAPLLQSGSGAKKVRFAPRRALLWATWEGGACARALWVCAAAEVRSQGGPPVDAQGGGGRAWVGLSLGVEWSSGHADGTRGGR